MKKIIALIGSPRKRATYQAVQEFEKNLKSYGEIEFEYVFLSDAHLGNCKGCILCFNKGEEFCPLKDDRNILLEKIQHSDGVILATPNYAFQVTSYTKNFLDRISFILHRPRFFGKAFIAVVTQGIFGGASIIRYLEFVGKGLGFQVMKGCYLTALEPRTVLEQEKVNRKIQKASLRFYKQLMHPALPTPSFIKLIMFRISRTSIKKFLNENYRDYRYYQEKGWFESDYYYPTSLGLTKKAVAYFGDILGKWMFRKNRG